MANRFWVGGGSSTNWNATGPTNWAATSGSATKVAAPTSTDDVFFDANSGTGNSVISANITINSLDCTGYTGTITHNTSVTLTIAGSGVTYKLVAGMTYTLGNSASSATSFTGTSGTTTINTTGNVLGNVTFNGVGGTWSLSNSLIANTVTLTNGTFNTNGKVVIFDNLSSSNSNTRTLTLGATTMTLNPAGATAWNTGTTTGLTFNANTSSITISSGNFINGSLTFNTVTISATCTITGGATYANLKLLPTSGATVTFSTNQTITTRLTCTGADANVNRLKLVAGITTFPYTLTAAAVTLSNTDFSDTQAAGAAIPFTGTSLGDLGGTSNITFTTPVNRFWVGGTGNWGDTGHWSASSGGSSGATMPIVQDTAIFDTNSFSADGQTVTFNLVTNHISSIDSSLATNHTHTLTASGNINIYNSVVKLSAMTTLSVNALLTTYRGATQLTQGGATLNFLLTVSNTSGSLTLQDNVTISGGILVTAGDFNTGNHDLTCNTFSDFGANTKSATFGSSRTLTLTSTGNIFTFYGTGSTLTTNSVNIAITDTSSSNKTFDFGSTLTWGNVSVTGGGSGSVTFTLGGILTTMGTVTIGGPKTVIATGGTTLWVGGFVATGSQGNLVTLQSTSGAVVVSNIGNGIVTCDWLSIQSWSVSNSSGLPWYAGIHSTNVSGNSGWKFVMNRHGFINHQNPGVS